MVLPAPHIFLPVRSKIWNFQTTLTVSEIFLHSESGKKGSERRKTRKFLL